MKMTFQEIRIIATDPCIANQLRDVNTICRRSWYIAAHIWKIYDFKIEVVPLIINILYDHNTYFLSSPVCQTCLIDLYRKMTEQFRPDLFDDSDPGDCKSRRIFSLGILPGIGLSLLNIYRLPVEDG